MKHHSFKVAAEYLNKKLGGTHDIHDMVENGDLAAGCWSNSADQWAYYTGEEVTTMGRGHSIGSLVAYSQAMDARSATLVHLFGENSGVEELGDIDLIGGGTERFTYEDLRVPESELKRYVESVSSPPALSEPHALREIVDDFAKHHYEEYGVAATVNELWPELERICFSDTQPIVIAEIDDDAVWYKNPGNSKERKVVKKTVSNLLSKANRTISTQ